MKPIYCPNCLQESTEAMGEDGYWMWCLFCKEYFSIYDVIEEEEEMNPPNAMTKEEMDRLVRAGIVQRLQRTPPVLRCEGKPAPTPPPQPKPLVSDEELLKIMFADEVYYGPLLRTVVHGEGIAHYIAQARRELKEILEDKNARVFLELDPLPEEKK